MGDRRARLEDLLTGAEGAVRLTPVLELNPALHHALVADGWEGTVATRTTGRYRCGRRSNAWLKLRSPAARDRDRRRFLASLAAERRSTAAGGGLPAAPRHIVRQRSSPGCGVPGAVALLGGF